MQVEIAIPTYRRYDILCRKTLGYLFRCYPEQEIPVTLFVANADEEAAYRLALRQRKWEERVKIVRGKAGLGPQRNFIQQYYPEGTNLWQMDDDLDGLFERTGKQLIPTHYPLEMARDAFRMLRGYRLRLWGVYPVDNDFFMDSFISFDLRYIVGACFGIIVTHDSRTYVRLEDKEDFERTLRYYVCDGGVMRLNYIAVKTNYYTEPGGMQVTRTHERVERSARLLKSWFPTLCEIDRSGKRGYTELRLHDASRKKGNKERVLGKAR